MAGVIAAASRAKSADAVLRETLRTAGGLTAAESREVSHTVFAYYRWLGWLDRTLPVGRQVEQAMELARRFNDAPEGFSEDELLARAVPAWAREEIKVTPEWAAAIQSEPVLWLRAKRGQGEKLARKLGDGAVHALTAAAELVGVRPAGQTPKESAIVQTAMAVSRTMQIEEVLREGSTDSNVPMNLHIPAITISGGGAGTGTHSLNETFDPKDSWRGTERALLLAIALAR